MNNQPPTYQELQAQLKAHAKAVGKLIETTPQPVASSVPVIPAAPPSAPGTGGA